MASRLLRRQRSRVPRRWRLSAILATWFGVGLLPWTPGTWGSLSALPVAWIIAENGGPWALLAGAAIVFAVGCWAAAAYEADIGVHDPGAIVIDEVAAQWLTLVLVPPNLALYLGGFLLFRIADVLKIWPANRIDRRLSGGVGVMLDDIVAGIYAGAALLAITHGVG